MSLLHLLRRAAGHTPRYLLRRAIVDLGRRARARGLRRRLDRETAAGVARRAGFESLREAWKAGPLQALVFSPADKARLRELYEGSYATAHGRLRETAQRILVHEFDLLGSGPSPLGPEIDWSLDFKSGARWDPGKPSHALGLSGKEGSGDVKVPWELSRGQHLTRLAQAWVLDRDARAASEFATQIGSWIRSNPPGMGVNWSCTMDVALRALSWIWSLTLLEDSIAPALGEELLLSLYQHGVWIARNLEVGEVNGNHYLCDALGLVACGASFASMEEGRRWLSQGSDMLEAEMRRQVGTDGVDFEGSVAYHRLVLEVLLVGRVLMKAAGRPPSPEFDDRLVKMIEFVCAYVTPEGLSPVIGDADDGRALVLGRTEMRDHRYLLSTGAAMFGRADWKARSGGFQEDSLWLLGPSAHRDFEALPARIDPESRVFPEAGFVVFHAAQHYLFVDVGPVGFQGHGGHGHNDCLSFEWHAFGRPLLTDSGTFVYTASPEWRNRFRSTAYHNTIRIDGEELNRFPSSLALWSLRNDAVPFDVTFRSGPVVEVLEASHAGYHRLAEPVTVRRQFVFDRHSARVTLTDRLTGHGKHRVETFFHAAPGAVGQTTPEDGLILHWPGSLSCRIRPSSPSSSVWRKDVGWFSPSYGIKIVRESWVACADVSLPFEIVWELSADPKPA